jgi:hypothetical protein
MACLLRAKRSRRGLLTSGKKLNEPIPKVRIILSTNVSCSNPWKKGVERFRSLERRACGAQGKGKVVPFNEDSRVKLPAILHLVRLGYAYLSKDDAEWDGSTNIFPNIFRESVRDINQGRALCLRVKKARTGPC